VRRRTTEGWLGSGSDGGKEEEKGFAVHTVLDEKMCEDEIVQITKSFGSVESLGDKDFKSGLCFFDRCLWRPKMASEGVEWSEGI
jgi:hypothetical protein